MASKTERKLNRAVVSQIAFVAALLAFVAFAFFTYARENSRRILTQNENFIGAATELNADRINDKISLSQRTVNMMGKLYGTVVDAPELEPETLDDMAARTLFDYVEFITPDGVDHTADGRTADLKDRAYFQSGMRGESGQCVVHDSRITNETLLIFYTPYYYRQEIAGVLTGVLRAATIQDLLAEDYFGVSANSYMIERDGGIILSTLREGDSGNMLDRFAAGERVTGEALERLSGAIANEEAMSFTYEGAYGTGNAYVTPLKDCDWVLVQYMSSAINSTMTRKAYAAGFWLEAKLLVAFLLYSTYLILRGRMQKRRLVSEKDEVSRLVDTTTALFTRFSLVNFDEDSYRYLQNKRGEAPEEGVYSELVAYLADKYVHEDSDAEPMEVVIGCDYVREHLTSDVPYLQFEYQIDMGGRRWENISILCVERGEDGKPRRVLYAIQDVTALKERERQIRLALRSATEAAEAANRAKSDFLARMSHDIRTPMNAIMGMTAVAAMHIDDPERVSDCLGKITISSRHLLALINDVLDMSKIESGKVVLSEEPFGMADMVESLVTIIQGQVNAKRQTLRVHISHIDHEDVIGDTLRLRQVFVNILGNAVKFTPEGGTITFSISELPSSITGMACYRFVCEDTGIGMDEAFLKTIFDPFTRADNSASRKIEGTGLGMSITRNIVRMMEGDIDVRSKLGEGSAFTVTLYLKLQEQTAEDAGELKDLRVLVADDDPSSCESACDILHSVGMNAKWVLSGEEAVAETVRAHEARDDFSVVILDWKMPGKDGIQTAREIRARVGDGVPIIFLSGYDWSEVEEEARAAGITAFIEKPLFRSRLVYALRSVLVTQPQDALPAGNAVLESGFAGKRVLLVEDNELNREIAVELLSSIGVEVEEAENGQMAVEMVEGKPAGHYNLVFMDIQMPVMDGYAAARRIRAMRREDAASLPVIAMTANAFADDIREAHEAGMNDHIAKPVEVAKLEEILRKWL